MKFKTKIPDLDYYKENIPCQTGCPISTSCGLYVQAIACGNFEKAYKIARKPNPFAYSIGRVCTHPCETLCRRQYLDKPVSICSLKRAATDRHNIGLGHNPGNKPPPLNGKKIAIIGSGASGLTCAHDLRLLGYKPVVYEATSAAGGMMQLGIPQYRLPREIVNYEIGSIKNMGVDILMEQRVGSDISLSELCENYDAVFIAAGLNLGTQLNIPGNELDGVFNGIDFLLNMNLGYNVKLGNEVIVVGGGNVAMDVARYALRSDEINTGGPEAIDAARMALRAGAHKVTTVCLEKREEMPAWKREIEEAEEEGVQLLTSLGPTAIIGKDDKVTGLEVIECTSVFNKDKKFSPVYKENSNHIIPCDSVILAIGQKADLTWIEDLEITERGTIKIDSNSMTSRKGVFAGGDFTRGPSILVEAVADGTAAARSIHRFLSSGSKFKEKAKMVPLSNYEMPAKPLKTERIKEKVLNVNRRVGISEINLGYEDPAALKEGSRCLKCQINTIFDSSKCILCGGCVDVCPEYCLKIVSADELEINEGIDILLKKTKTKHNLKAIIKDETICIRCGLCAKRCPAGAITMEEFDYSVLDS